MWYKNPRWPQGLASQGPWSSESLPTSPSFSSPFPSSITFCCSAGAVLVQGKPRTVASQPRPYTPTGPHERRTCVAGVSRIESPGCHLPRPAPPHPSGALTELLTTGSACSDLTFVSLSPNGLRPHGPLFSSQQRAVCGTACWEDACAPLCLAHSCRAEPPKGLPGPAASELSVCSTSHLPPPVAVRLLVTEFTSLSATELEAPRRQQTRLSCSSLCL